MVPTRFRDARTSEASTLLHELCDLGVQLALGAHTALGLPQTICNNPGGYAPPTPARAPPQALALTVAQAHRGALRFTCLLRSGSRIGIRPATPSSIVRLTAEGGAPPASHERYARAWREGSPGVPLSSTNTAGSAHHESTDGALRQIGTLGHHPADHRKRVHARCSLASVDALGGSA